MSDNVLKMALSELKRLKPYYDKYLLMESVAKQYQAGGKDMAASPSKSAQKKTGSASAIQKTKLDLAKYRNKHLKIVALTDELIVRSGGRAKFASIHDYLNTNGVTITKRSLSPHLSESGKFESDRVLGWGRKKPSKGETSAKATVEEGSSQDEAGAATPATVNGGALHHRSH